VGRERVEAKLPGVCEEAPGTYCRAEAAARREAVALHARVVSVQAAAPQAEVWRRVPEMLCPAAVAVALREGRAWRPAVASPPAGTWAAPRPALCAEADYAGRWG